MEIVFIRHSVTEGNKQRRYVGSTDEGLSSEGRELAEKTAAELPEPGLLYVSPMLRCRETAELLFPGKEYTTVENLRETDFGKFEYKTYEELKNDADYCAWLDSGGSGAIPGGESAAEVSERVLKAFNKVLKEILSCDKAERATFVVHGGTIMTVMSALGLPERDYYSWQVKNCRGFITEPEGERLRVIREL